MSAKSTNRELKRLWRQWTGLLSRRLKTGRLGVSALQYEELHQRLMSAFRLSRKLSPTKELTTLHKLEKLVAPWVSIDAINQAEHEVMENLVGRCRHLERSWLGHDLHVSAAAWTVLLIATVLSAVVFGVVYFALQNNDSPMYWLQRIQDYATELRFAVMRASLFEKIAGITFVLVLISIRLLAYKR